VRHYVIHLNYTVTVQDDADIDAVAQELQVELAELGYAMELEDFSIEEATDGSYDRFHSGTGESINDESYEQYLNGPSNPL
jgi:hypothetical protein